MTEEDNGRFKQTKAERDRHRFKVPGLRNIELTAPYSTTQHGYYG